MNVLNIESIANYLSNTPRRRALLKSLNKTLILALWRDSEKRLNDIKEEEAAAAEEQKKRQAAAKEIVEQMKKSGLTVDDLALMEAPAANQATNGHSRVKKSRFKLPDGRIVLWSRRGKPTSELQPFVDQYGLQEVLSWQIED